MRFVLLLLLSIFTTTAHAFYEETISFGVEEWPLQGTLTIPDEKSGKFPVAILIHGSGPHDQDCTFGPNKPFRDIAEGLSQKGIAVFRFNKRTYTHARKYFEKKQTTPKTEVIEDVLSAIEAIAVHEHIDKNRIFLIGHSMGGSFAPHIAKAAKTPVHGVVVMAGSTRSLFDLMLEQCEYLLEQDLLSHQSRMHILTMRTSILKRKEMGQFLGAPLSYFEEADKLMHSTIDTLVELSIPCLITRGERDYQVTERDFSSYERALLGNDKATLKTFPKLNHMFMEGEGPSLIDEYAIEGKVDTSFLDTVAKWLLTH